MSALESSYSPRRQSASSSPDASSHQGPSDTDNATSSPAYSLPPLPAYTYGKLNVKVPAVPTNFDQSPSDPNVSDFTETPECENHSPDPHEFYRRYQDSFSRSSREGLHQGDIFGKRDDDPTMSRHYRRQSPPSSRTSFSKPSTMTARVYLPHGSRYNSTSSTEQSPLNSAKSNPALSNPPRNRQTSLKDLVNKFNQNLDEVPPLPRKTNSRSTSTHSNSGNSNPATSISYARARTSSQSKPGPQEVLTGPHQYFKTQKHQRRGRLIHEAAISPRSHGPASTSYASQSLTDLPPSQHMSRKPLFGEVLAPHAQDYHPGYGISSPGRRRGSEGSMRSHNAMFPPKQGAQDVMDASPTSPSAWYLGRAPTLDEIKTEGVIPELPSRRHRRTRSDFTGVPSYLPATTYREPLEPPRSYPSGPSPPASPPKSKRNSQSRIPLSAQRMSAHSDSGNSTPSTRANSATDRHTGHVVPPRGSSALPKAVQQPSSPVRDARPTPSRYSPRRGRNSPGLQRLSTSPRLAAYISAPLLQKSPPLRSSRPRQPVSTASTSASRARAVDRFGGHESGQPKSPKHQRHKKPPELGGVDFAARRQKIQAAFTHTVKENERQEEIRRASMAQEAGASPQVVEEPQQQEANIEEAGSPVETRQERDMTESQEFETHEDVFQTPAEELPKSERELTINTGLLSERSVLDMSQEDSPTLGGFNQFSHVDEDDTSTPSEPEPVSAVTAGTADSVGTFFDDEPQDRSPSASPREDRSTLLSHIMSIRDHSPSSPTSVRRPQTAESSDKDDRESIQIMLGETPVLEKSRFNELHEGTSREASASEQPGNRWSMSSWTSSSRSKDRQSERQSFDNEREGRMERIDELSPAQSQQNGHLSVSTAASAHTQQPWSPATFSSPLTTRSTIDSDAYSTINRVLDHYHDSSTVVSPELMSDVQQHIFTQSPDLARQGGWDPKKVTQLYLQELARNRLAQPNNLPDPHRSQQRGQGALQPPISVPREEKIVDPSAPQTGAAEVEQGLEVTRLHNRSGSLEVDEGDNKLHRASLNHPDDWEMSPSIGDWIHLQAADSPSEDKPTIPPKDWSAFKRELSKTKTRGDAQELAPSAGSGPQLPEIKGLGLEIGINVTSPQDDDDTPVAPPPPMPSHMPPPPPAASADQKGKQGRSPPSPSIYSKHVASTIPPRDFPVSLPMQTSSDSSQPPETRASSAQPSINSSISQAQTSTDATKPERTPEQKRLFKRCSLIKELVDTEHSFGQDMKVVEDIYKGTSNVIIISSEDVKTLFSNSDQIVAFSTAFLDALKQAAKSVYILPKSKRWRSNRLSNATSQSGGTDDQSSIHGPGTNDEDKDRQTFMGDAFVQHMAEMEKVYSDYLKNHDAANQKLAALQKNEKVQIWLKECRAYAHDLTTAWDLDSLLVKPVQRILKYPLLLDHLLELTPENHPDFTKLDIASREMKGITVRINEMKKRADLMDQMTNQRKRKESDVRIGLSKAFGRRTEKLRQQVGLSDMVEDKEYNAVSDKFGSHFFQLQVVMRDVEMYTTDVQLWMNRFSDFIMAIENHIDVGQTSYPELESKWRKFRMSTREMSMTALTDHINAIRKNVIEPMTTLLKLHDSPQKLMQKRNKRIMDYARYKGIKDRGDKPDKKTTEQGEQFMAINESLKHELPKLFALTGRLVEACLNNFVQLQLQWHIIWRRKLGQALDNYKATGPISELIDAFTGDFAFFEAQLLSLGICNGSMLAESVNMVNMLSPARTLTGEESSQKKPSLDLTRRRTTSVNSDMSPVLPQPDFGSRNGAGGFFGMDNGMPPTSMMPPMSNQSDPGNRMRANSTMAGRSPRTPNVPGSYHSYSSNTTPVSTGFGRSATATATGPSPMLSRPAVETPDINRISEATTLVQQPNGNTVYASGAPARPSSPSGRYSGVFTSALPMSDSPRNQSPVENGLDRPPTQFNVIFLAASVYEFNIDRARREAGYPYLTYVAGEIFDVIGEKGELWLAKNQDDRTNQVGWIWNKHFCKLAS
ncbi:MAG: hypothetical protein LQ339_008337 [Xanthoria mediterranea]|nr:MAG: hypothetical protein LQ339_008337 [Xanthoria mediterranea]